MSKNEEVMDTQKIPDNVMVGILDDAIRELKEAKLVIESQYEELRNAYDSVMRLSEEGKEKVRKAMYADEYVDSLRKMNDDLIAKNKRLQRTNDELVYKLSQMQEKGA